jgi:hypothetical protein
VLQVISSSPGDLQPVFDAMLENAVRICEAKFGLLYLYEGGGGFRSVATRDLPPAFAEVLGKEQFSPAPGGVLDTVMKTVRTVHLSDLSVTQGYLERHPRMVASVELGGARTVVAVPAQRKWPRWSIRNLSARSAPLHRQANCAAYDQAALSSLGIWSKPSPSQIELAWQPV